MKYEGPEMFRPPGGIWNFSYKLTFEGLLALEKSPFRPPNQPYKNKKNMERIQIIWRIAKIIMAAASTLAIIYLTYLQVKN